jgi:hypothetical protein
MNLACCLVAAAALPFAGAFASAAAHAEGFGGSIALSTDRVERGVSQSGGQAALAGDLEWSHRRGAYIGLGASSADAQQFGGAELQWSPRLGWRGAFADNDAGSWGVGLTGQLFPGASGQRATTLPPRAAAATAQAQDTDFATAELNLSLGWEGWRLSLDRALTDYYGIGEESVQATTPGQRVVTQLAGSAGSWHAGLNYRHQFNGHIHAWAGVGRQVIRNFDALNYTDWSLGASVQALGLSWSLEATGTNASTGFWQVQRSSGGTRELATRRVAAGVAWEF